ncbi:hypothetical protein D3260_12110 [Salinisphaera sp. Q1T1-3]|nr:hypothetical protein D3260_12110 [Salinisphaera sp. Q1T1-3]
MQRQGYRWLGMAAAALGLLMVGCAHAEGQASQQRIYLDPATGDVIDAPGEAHGSAQRATRTNDGDSPYKAWQTEDGTKMLSVAPGGGAAETVVHCPDGSLRMGHAGDGSDEADRKALCRAGGAQSGD